ncbi:thiamine-phosphate kinase [Amycolatopsis samaneae]
MWEQGEQMSGEERYSDEPTRLAELVKVMFGDQALAYRSREATPSGRVRLLVGADSQDDCAVFGFSGEQQLVIGSDYVRGPKFRLYEYGLLGEYDLGYYLVAANVSDVAAMGAQPIGLLSVVRYPPEMSDSVFRQVMQGIRDACEAFGAPNVGGDIGGAERLILSATALGVCRPGGALLRSGAKTGDLVCLTAPTGMAGAAAAYFRSPRVCADIEQNYREELLSSWTRPLARTTEGVVLGNSGVVTSCQDTSDGLKATLESIAFSSGVGMTVFERELRIPEAVRKVCEYLNLEPLPVIMGDSVDFELVFTVSPVDCDRLRGEFERAGIDFHSIGVVVDGGEVVFEASSGKLSPLPGKAWRHTPESPPHH